MYWQGARLTGLYPASLLLDYLGLNITVVSRHDFVDFGLIACRKTVPHVQRLLDYLEDELAALEAAAKLAASKGDAAKPRKR
jgi:diacylglycerol O-acyltransferase